VRSAQLITRMARENFLWGAPRVHGELRMLGFSVSQATVSRYMPAAIGDRDNRGGRFCAIKPSPSAPTRIRRVCPAWIAVACMPGFTEAGLGASPLRRLRWYALAVVTMAALHCSYLMLNE
jgi:hypothetical protein